MKKFLFALLFLIITSYANASEYTQENPKLVECKSCHSNYDYELIAKNYSERNQAVYVMVFNESTESLRTYRVFEIYEPQDPYLNMTRANLVSTDQKHIDDFQGYLALKSSESVPVLDLDRNYQTDNPYGIFRSVNRALKDKFGIFYKRMQNGTMIYAQSKNEFKLLLVKVKTIGLTSEQFEVLLVEDEDGNIVDVMPTSNTDGTVSPSAGGSYFFSGPHGGYTICVSSDCGAPEGTVTVEEVEEE